MTTIAAPQYTPADLLRWQRELLRYVHRLTGDPDLSEDLAQEALMRLLRATPDAPMKNVRAWLYRVATNLVRDHARRSDMMRRRPVPVDADLPQTPEQALERRETVAQVRAALDRLSPRDRTVLVLRESGFKHREIADVVHVRAESVSVIIGRALQRFRKAYREEVRQ
jgi:RNA polymerase sigma-70 factor (ECF subfamily)